MNFSRFFVRLALILLIAVTSSPLFATWNEIAQFSNEPVSAMYFFDANHGFIGFRGINGIAETTDGGMTWVNCSVPNFGGTTPWIGDIWFANPLEGYATYVYSNGISCLITTVDGGRTWINSTNAGNGCAVRRTSKALIVSRYAGLGSGISVSTDNGASFPTLFSGNVDGIDFVDDLHGAASGFTEFFRFTSDGGVTWQQSRTNLTNEAWGMYGVKGTATFIAVGEDISVGSESHVYLSTDYGVDWQKVGGVGGFRTTGDLKGSGAALYIQKSTEDLTSTADGLYRSTDLGKTWTNVGGPSNAYDSRIFVTACGSVIYAADLYGGLYRSTDGGDGTMSSIGETGLSITATQIAFPLAPRCTVRDTTFIISNGTCNAVSVSGVDISGVGFSTSSGAMVLQAFAHDTIHLHYDGMATDTVVATVHVHTNYMGDSTYTIHVLGAIPPDENVRLLLKTSIDPVRAGDTMVLTCHPDRIVQNKGLTSISGVLEYYNDCFDLLSVQNTSGLTLTTSPLEVRGTVAHLRCRITGNVAFSLDPSVPLFQLQTRRMLSDSSNTRFWIDSLSFNGGDPDYNRCILAGSSVPTISHLDPVCGDTILLRELRKQPLLLVTNAYPNPVTSEHHYQASISLLSEENGQAIITLNDATGATISQNILSLQAAQQYVHNFELSKLPPGSYYYSIDFTTADKQRWKTGSVVVVR